MKKLFKILASVLTVVTMCFALTGCASVKGNTYAFKEVTYSGEELNSIEEGLMLIAKGVVEIGLNGVNYTFNNDGTYDYKGIKTGKYSQSGSELKMYALTAEDLSTATVVNQFTVKGSTIVQETKEDGYTFTIVFEKI